MDVSLFLSLMMLMIHGEIIPEYFPASEQKQSMLEQRNNSLLLQNSSTQDANNILMQVFSRPYKSMIRRKRDWLIPPVSIAENDRGPFPKTVVQCKATAAESMEMFYKITGAGADQESKGVFTIGKRSGMLWVTKALDREETKEYELTVHASALGQNYIENPVQLIINVIDQNDNRPVCDQNPFMGEILERAKLNVPVVKVTATDLDDPDTANGIVRYKLLTQEPNGGMFKIDPTTGLISLASMGILDRETAEYKLAVEAADMEGHGLSSTCTVIIKITDSNDHPPVFSQKKYTFPVQENKIGEIDGRLIVTDRDELFTANLAVKFTIIRGNEAGLFSISTGPSGMEGVITSTKGLDFELVNSLSLLVKVENLAPFAVPLVTSTATVSISVQDVNEAPVFDPAEKRTIIHEDFPVGGNVTRYTANDPDTARNQKIRRFSNIMPGIPERTQNMFQEGLHQVFFKERPLPHPISDGESTAGELMEDRLVRWFGTVVNTRVLLCGVVQIFSAVSCILSTFSYTCLTFTCSPSMTAPVWCGLFYVATGSLAIDVQRKPKKVKVMTLMGLNIFSLLFAICSFATFFLKSSQLDRATPQQRIGVYILKGSGVVSILQCMFAAMYILFLIWRGMRSYSASYRQDYISVAQSADEPTEPLLENEHFSL